MKRTGIVRRIDDLGRIVIPKEVRRTLRLRDGDPMEISIGRDGEVIFKKYSPIGELGDFALEYAQSLFEVTGHIALIADRDIIIAVAGGNKRDYVNKVIGGACVKALEGRYTLVMNQLDNPKEKDLHIIKMGEDETYPITSQVIAPIVNQGDPIGAVMIVAKDSTVQLGEMEVKLAETAAAFLAKQMEQ